MYLERKNTFYIITGGPGTGKTTLVHALKEKEVAVIPEAAREIIRQQIAINGEGLPWKNKEWYTDLMLESSIQDYKAALKNHTNGICFFDRSVLDALCYAEMIDYTIAETVMKEVLSCQYNKKVFILPPWQEIYKIDNERKQLWEEAEYTYHKMKATYKQYGYEVIDVPKDTVSNRKKFVLNHIGK